MRRRWPAGKTWWLGGLALLAVLGLACLAWTRRHDWLARYEVYRLTRAGEAGRDTWIERVAGRETACLPQLLAVFRQNDLRACGNAQAALAHLAGRWPADDGRRVLLADQLAEEFPQFSPPGRHAALDLEIVLTNAAAEEAPRPAFAASASRLLTEVARQAESDLRKQALTLAEALLRQPPPPEVLTACRDLAAACLHDPEAEIRVRAVRLTTQAPLNLLEQVPPLLRDAAAEVRRAALLAVGPVPEVLATDDLLYSLHDADAGVRRLCENALRGRGLPDDHIQLGRFLTAEDAKTRLRVLEYLRKTTGLSPGTWLRRLSHDPAAAVRAAAVRAAVEFTQVDLTDRMEQVAQDDPSPTVRQLAAYYLTCRKSDGE